MLLSYGFLEILVAANRISRKVAGCLFFRDHTSQTVKVIDRTSAKDGFINRWRLMNCVSLALLYRICHARYMENLEHEVDANKRIIEINLCIMMLTVCLVIGERYRIRGKSPHLYTSFINAAIQIEMIFRKDQTQLMKIKAAKFLFGLTRIMCKWVYHAPMAIMCAVEPSLPFNMVWLPDHLMIQSSIQCLQPKGVCRYFVNFTGNYIIWNLIAVQGYCVMCDVLVGVMTLAYCQKACYRDMSKLIASASSPFVLNTEEFQVNLLSTMRNHRGCQILVELFNEALCTILASSLITCGICQIVSAQILISDSVKGSVSLPLKLFFAVVIIETFLIFMIEFGFAGDFYQESEQILVNLKRNANDKVKDRRCRIHMKLFFASCQVSRIRFGLSNYIEKITPPIFQEFCLSRIIDILLVQK